MPLFVLTGHDGPQGLERRKECREAHLANLEPLEAAGRVRFGGPVLDGHGQPAGSLVIFEADSLADARAFAATDPYVTRGVFATWEVREIRQVFPKS